MAPRSGDDTEVQTHRREGRPRLLEGVVARLNKRALTVIHLLLEVLHFLAVARWAKAKEGQLATRYAGGTQTLDSDEVLPISSPN